MFSLCSLSVPANHCTPHLAGHTGVSRRALLGQESGWGFTEVTAPKQAVCGVATWSSLGSPLVPRCWRLQATVTQEALTSPRTAPSPCHMPPLLTTWLFISSTPAGVSVSLHIILPLLSLLWAAQTQPRIISLWVTQQLELIKQLIWLTQTWSQLQNCSCQMIGQNSSCGIHVMYGPCLHTSLD